MRKVKMGNNSGKVHVTKVAQFSIEILGSIVKYRTGRLASTPSSGKKVSFVM